MWPVVAHAQLPEAPYAACSNGINLTAWVKATFDDTVPNLKVVKLGPDVRATVVENHNRTAPLSNDDPANVYFLSSEGDPVFVMIFTDEDDCVTHAWPIPVAAKMHLLHPHTDMREA